MRQKKADARLAGEVPGTWLGNPALPKVYTNTNKHDLSGYMFLVQVTHS